MNHVRLSQARRFVLSLVPGGLTLSKKRVPSSRRCRYRIWQVNDEFPVLQGVGKEEMHGACCNALLPACRQLPR